MFGPSPPRPSCARTNKIEQCLARARRGPVAHEQIKYNMALLKPGLCYKDLTDKMLPMADEFIPGRYGVAMHGLGLCDEAPAIYYREDYADTGYDGVFEEGMVMCVEALIGSKGGKECVKLEEQVLITADGCEQLTTYPLEDGWL